MDDLPLYLARAIHVADVRSVAVELVMIAALLAWVLLDWRQRPEDEPTDPAEPP